MRMEMVASGRGGAQRANKDFLPAVAPSGPQFAENPDRFLAGTGMPGTSFTERAFHTTRFVRTMPSPAG